MILRNNIPDPNDARYHIEYGDSYKLTLFGKRPIVLVVAVYPGDLGIWEADPFWQKAEAIGKRYKKFYPRNAVIEVCIRTAEADRRQPRYRDVIEIPPSAVVRY